MFSICCYCPEYAVVNTKRPGLLAFARPGRFTKSRFLRVVQSRSGSGCRLSQRGIDFALVRWPAGHRVGRDAQHRAMGCRFRLAG
jgi:hypothetical protein